MDLSLKPAEPKQLLRAVLALSKDPQGIMCQFSDEEALQILILNSRPVVNGVILRMKMDKGIEEDKAEEEPFMMDDKEVGGFAIRLIQFGVALGRHYELTGDEPTIVKSCSLDDAFKMHKGE